MERFAVECLRCGATREIHAREHAHVDTGECDRCEYVGWALVAELNERVRRVLRERPPERRRLYAA